MAKINFQYFGIPTGIDKASYQIGDARECVANMLYRNMNGIRAHALALKIYGSNGETEYSDEEIHTLIKAANTFGTPAFIDGLNEQLIKSDRNYGTITNRHK